MPIGPVSLGMTSAVSITPPSSELAEDEALVVRLQSGDRSALARLLARYQRSVSRFIAGRISDPALAEDLTQETWLRCVSRIGGLRQPGAFAGWLFRIAGNVCMDHYRKRDQRPEALGEAPQADPRQRTGSGAYRAQASLGELREAVAELPDNQRVAIELRHQSGMRCKEIAQVMGTSVGSVTKWLSRAYETLRERVDR